MTSLWGSKGTLLKCLIQEERWGLALEGSAQEGVWLQHCKFGQMDKGMCKIEEDVLTAPWSACITSMLLWHPNTTWYSVCEGGQKKKNSYHVCITFRHITFGRTPGVLAILTRPLHTQRAKNTEGVNQSSCTVGKSRNQETVYSGKIHTQRTPQHSSQGSLLLTNSSELTSGLMGKQTNRITLKAYEIHPPPQLLL